MKDEYTPQEASAFFSHLAAVEHDRNENLGYSGAMHGYSHTYKTVAEASPSRVPVDLLPEFFKWVKDYREQRRLERERREFMHDPEWPEYQRLKMKFRSQ